LAWSYGCFPQSGSLYTHYSRSTVHAQPPKVVKQFYEIRLFRCEFTLQLWQMLVPPLSKTVLISQIKKLYY
jgi:hypothetical protein